MQPPGRASIVPSGCMYAALGDAASGDVTQAQIDAQINQLNHCFGPASFVFQLAGVYRYKNPAWWNLDVNSQVRFLHQAAHAVLCSGSMRVGGTCCVRRRCLKR